MFLLFISCLFFMFALNVVQVRTPYKVQSACQRFYKAFVSNKD